MFNTTQSISAIACAAFVASLVALLTAAAPKAGAEPLTSAAVQAPYGKADRLPQRTTGTACSDRGWPYYEQSCQFDRRRAADDVQTVRVIALR